MIARLAAQRVVPVVRAASVTDAVATARVCAEAGMEVVELTHSTPAVEEALDALRGDGLVLGLGTVTDRDQVRAAAEAGTSFVVSFAAPAGLVAEAHRYGLAAVLGAFSPSEVLACARQGADAVKLFPAAELSPRYVSDLRTVLPGLRLTATGGLRATRESAGAWLEAGADWVGLGGDFGTVAGCGAAELSRRVRAALELAASVG
jgi:2-dehydro-3-deoxyphosphogluconate aldolase/(4S)-4-hydroxy-2-oxoglutarate aldolase